MRNLLLAAVVLLLFVSSAFVQPGTALAKEPPGADLVDLKYYPENGLAALSGFELFWSSDGQNWNPAGFSDRAVSFTALGLGKKLVLVGTRSGVIFRSIDGAPFREVKPPKDPYGRVIKGIRYIAIHPKGEEVLASGGQGVIRSRDRGATWEAIADPFWSKPKAREVIGLGYVKGDPVVVTRFGAYRSGKKGFELFSKGLPDEVRPTVATVSEGEIVMALPGNGIYVAKKDSSWKKLKGVPGDPIAFIGRATSGYLAARPTSPLQLSDKKGNKWALTGNFSSSFVPRRSVTTPLGDYLILRGKGLVRLVEDKFVPVELPIPLSAVKAKLKVDGVTLAGTQGGVFRSTSDGKAWEDVTPEDLGATVNVFLQLDDNRIILGAEGAGVFISDDDGQTWNNWSQGLGTANTVRGLASYRNGVIAATENGIMFRETAGPRWNHLPAGIGRTSISEMTTISGKIFIGTHAGMFKSDGSGDFKAVKGFDGTATSVAADGQKVAAVVRGKVRTQSGKGSVKELPSLPDRAVVLNVTLHKGIVYAGSNLGLYAWEGNAWQAKGKRKVPVEQLRSGPEGLRVITGGAGTYLVN